jgi:class 3 adenylate cyclase
MLSRGLTFLDPGKTVTLEVMAEPGALRGSSFDGDAGFLFIVDPARTPAEQRIAIRCDLDSCTPEGGTIAPGKVIFEMTSAAAKRFAFGVMQLPPNVDRPPPLHFAPYLSGKQLLTTQTFRDLFRSEVIRGSEGLGVKDIALLFTDLKGSTALYDRIGDLNAFSLVQQHFDRLQDVTVRNHGATIKTFGDAVMAAFLKPADAVQAALDMRSAIASFNERQPDKALILKIGIHKGAAIAVTQNERLDYFGQTVNIAARVQNLADADEIFVSQDVYDAAGVRDELKAFAVEPQTAHLRGVQQELPVFRVGAETRVAA